MYISDICRECWLLKQDLEMAQLVINTLSSSFGCINVKLLSKVVFF